MRAVLGLFTRVELHFISLNPFCSPITYDFLRLGKAKVPSPVEAYNKSLAKITSLPTEHKMSLRFREVRRLGQSYRVGI